MITKELKKVTEPVSCDHSFGIMRGTGKIYGIPQWQCCKCKKLVFAS